jgi:Domain of unknown function (DUF4337)
MPEGPEIETDKLREAIDAEIEGTGGGRMLRWISLSTAIIAAVAAVAALRAGDTVNEALALKTDAAQLQGRASDQWAYYQAKGIKRAVTQGQITTWAAAGRAVPPDIAAAEKKYAGEQVEIQAGARKLEGERDAKGREAEVLLASHHHYADAVALFQVAIALGAVAALTRMRPLWYASVALGTAGLVFFAWPMVAG